MSLSIEQLKHILEQNKHYINRDGSLNINELHKKAQECEPYLIELLVENDKTRNAFFFKKGSHQVFMRDKFIDYITHKDFLANSYTRYKNKIGLSSPEGFLKKQNDVVLDFPFKDCILEGGQSKDDEKRSEIYLNEVLAGREIDRLLDRKVLTQFQRIDQHGIHSLEKWNRNQEINQKRNLSEDTITDNLIIKGNNLLALHTMKREFSGKVKLIYIDPPYNTGGDNNIFTYNNNFNHSTWLTFMKNRLEIAKELLKEDGFIAIAIDHYELFYLGVLADEIFGRENRLGVITVVIKPEGRQFSKFVSVSNEYFLIYAKDKNNSKFNNIILDNDKKKEFRFSDNLGKYKLRKYINYNPEEISGRNIRPDFYYPIYVSSDLNDITLENKNNYIEILPIENKIEKTWQTKKETTLERIKNNELLALKEKDQIKIYLKAREVGRVLSVWTDKKYNANHHGTNLLKNLLGKNIFSYPKSLYTVLDTLKIMTDKNDIILDFFAGSGTTGHAVLELNKEDGGNRQFILIEQIENHIEVCKERVSKVIENKNDFVYMELKKYNQLFIEWIQKAKSTEELLTVKQQILEKAFLDFRLDTEAIKQSKEEFTKLKLSEQKQVLFEFLDKNQLYVNYSEKDDERYECTEQEKKLSKEFYRDE